MNRKRIILRIAAVLVLGAIGFGIACYVVFVRPTLQGIQGIPFVHQEWLQGSIRARGLMVSDLEKNQILNGKTRSEVIAFLGKPDHSSGDSISYTVDLGHKFCFEPWLYRLSIVLDDSDHVTHYYVHD